MRLGVLFAALLGFAAAAWLIVSVGVRAILSAFFAVGWGGFVLLCACGVVLFLVLGAAWYALVPRRENFRVTDFAWGRAVRECASELLPFSQFGGIVIGARALTLRGLSGPLAFATTIIDVTVEMIAQIAFVLAGLAFLLTLAPRAQENTALAKGVGLGTIAAIIAAALFFLIQQKATATLARWGRRYSPTAGEWLDRLHDSLSEIRAAAPALVVSLGIHFCGWLGTALWAWIALDLIGHRIPFAFVFTIEAILSGVRSAAVFIPGAVGVQEGCYALLGPLFGLAAPAAIALSLLKRARDVAIGLPVLLIWQIAEGGHALKAARDSVRRYGHDRSQ